MPSSGPRSSEDGDVVDCHDLVNTVIHTVYACVAPKSVTEGTAAKDAMPARKAKRDGVVIFLVGVRVKL